MSIKHEKISTHRTGNANKVTELQNKLDLISTHLCVLLFSVFYIDCNKLVNDTKKLLTAFIHLFYLRASNVVSFVRVLLF